MGKTEPQRRLDPEHEFIALDTVADMLRACGEHAFDTHKHKGEAMRKQAELWARHLLIGGTHPEHPNIKERDFVGVRNFVRQLRANESEFVRTALRDFRSLISTVFNNIERALLADGEADTQMKNQLTRLRGAVQTSSLEQLRREVNSVSTDLSTLLGTREKRRNQELATLGAELRQLNVRLEETRRTAETDPLTGVHNRRAFDAFLERVVEFDGVTGTPAALIMIDVDNFKLLNDTYGHPVGDEALRCIGAALSRTFLRKCDFVSRYGGEEFAVVIRDANANEAKRLAERARTAMPVIKLADHDDVALTVSVGVATLDHLENKSSWLKRADDALLEAKRAGKNCSVVARNV
jgi:diguanylate cyclase (GGDEF)-like protein